MTTSWVHPKVWDELPGHMKAEMMRVVGRLEGGDQVPTDNESGEPGTKAPGVDVGVVDKVAMRIARALRKSGLSEYRSWTAVISFKIERKIAVGVSSTAAPWGLKVGGSASEDSSTGHSIAVTVKNNFVSGESDFPADDSGQNDFVGYFRDVAGLLDGSRPNSSAAQKLVVDADFIVTNRMEIRCILTAGGADSSSHHVQVTLKPHGTMDGGSPPASTTGQQSE